MLADMRTRADREGGFTLIELLVVMIIIAILMAVAVPTFLAQKNNAQKSQATSNIKQIVNAVEACAANNTDGTYTNCDNPTAVLAFEKGLNTLTQAPRSFVAGPSTGKFVYGLEPLGTQGYRVSTAIQDGDVATLYFWETHMEDGTLLKECGTSLGTSAAVANSRTCTNGRWG